MCVIVAKPKGSAVSIATLLDCWLYNDDGAGVAWYEDGKLRIEKGFMEWEHFRDFWTNHGDRRPWEDVPAIIHFRIATHGVIDEENTHPFWVFPGKLAFAHNGVLYGPSRSASDNLSDTQIFNRHYLKQLPRNFLNNMGIKLFIEDFLGPSNKLAFINDKGKITIFGEHRGTWDDQGVWFSNTNHEHVVWARDWSHNRDGSWKKRGSLTPTDSVWSDNLKMFVDRADAIDAEELDGPSWLDEEEWYCYYCETTYVSREVDRWIEWDDPVCPFCSCDGASVRMDELRMMINDEPLDVEEVKDAEEQ